ncbi:Glu/Leu/Phe/Val dehydrogenase [Pseudalkalibacillus caeni]|uniref:Glutamate dehydrogenase n=2 Tax=Exobacillus caeni TaxID=2574798 RepID=A0A5R9FCQ9_9BACL|nr:Glu/Leu/Phe/Val dehydrogenase [Pseudalkalibacillus caeni]
MPVMEKKDGVEISNPYEIVQKLMEEATDTLGLPDSFYQILKKPKRVLKTSIPVRMDNGEVKEFEGMRSQHIDVLGPTKGGVRFHPDVNEDEVKALSIWMSLKAAILGIPYGGGKGGIIVNPKELSERELEELSRGFIRELEPIIGPEKDIPAPDVNTTPEIMGWMLDEFSRLKGKNVPGMITGKPIILGGSQGRVEATGRGVVFTIADAAKRLGMELEGMTAVIQGFGNVGSITAKLLSERGVKVMGITDAGGGVYNEDGLDIDQLMDYVKKEGTVAGFNNYDGLSNEELFSADCDILVPAALENQITSMTGPTIKAKIVAEAANGPTTPEGNEAMEENGVFIIPDILCNAGGVTVSYFEWVQNTMHYFWTEQEVNERLFTKMTNAFDDVYRMKQEKKVHMRDAAYLVGVGRLANAMRARGWIKDWSMPIDCNA